MSTESGEGALESERDRLALLTRKGIGMPLAGLIYWLAVAVILHQMPQRSGIVVCFFAAGASFHWVRCSRGGPVAICSRKARLLPR